MKMPENKLVYLLVGVGGLFAGSLVYDILTPIFQSIFSFFG